MNLKFRMKRNDLAPSISAALKQAGLAMDLTSCTVRFLMRSNIIGTELKVNAPAVIVNALAGKVRYDWAGTDTDTEGHYLAEWEVTPAGGKPLTVPTEGFIQVFINKDLG